MRVSLLPQKDSSFLACQPLLHLANDRVLETLVFEVSAWNLSISSTVHLPKGTDSLFLSHRSLRRPRDASKNSSNMSFLVYKKQCVIRVV